MRFDTAMQNTGMLTAIRESYDTLGLSVEEIAEQQELDVTAVKAALLQSSAKYRAQSKKEDELNFTPDEQAIAKRVIAELAMGAEDDHVRLRAAKYLRDDAKGRLDLGKASDLRINVLQFNQILVRAKESIAEGMRKTSQAPAQLIEA